MEYGFSLETGFIREKYEKDWERDNQIKYGFHLNSRFSASFIYALNEHHHIKTGVQLANTSYARPWEKNRFDINQREVREINIFIFPVGYRIDMDKSDFEPFIEMGLLPGIFIRSVHEIEFDNGETGNGGKHVQLAGDMGIPLFIGAYASLGWNIKINENTEVFVTPSFWVYRQWKPEFSIKEFYINYGLNLGARYQFYKEQTD
ncbi:MAG: hypothetical protein R2879_22245 [Saprospiraceae bacterium]